MFIHLLCLGICVAPTAKLQCQPGQSTGEVGTLSPVRGQFHRPTKSHVRMPSAADAEGDGPGAHIQYLCLICTVHIVRTGKYIIWMSGGDALIRKLDSQAILFIVV